MQTLYGTLGARFHHCFYLTNGFTAMPPNPALNRSDS